jgi:hypothetical protein
MKVLKIVSLALAAFCTVAVAAAIITVYKKKYKNNYIIVNE